MLFNIFCTSTAFLTLMTHLRFRASLLALAIVFPFSVARAAGVFPDVSDLHPFKGEIESLFRSGIVKGNPDGKYYPDKSVNRAEFLKLLYTATKRTPKAVNAKCFKDVVAGSWYELIVCDAASKENYFVQGYGDGNFKPGNPVSRTEALKMVFTVMGLTAGDVSSTDKDIIKFADISVSAWYTKYISAAYRNGILPIFGFGGARFYPDKELMRGEAAAYIFNAMKVVEAKASMTQGRSSSAGYAPVNYTVKDVVFPFNDTDQFKGKLPIAYAFELKDPKTVVSVNVGTTGTSDSDVTCRLYLLQEDGFSSEYYLGVQDKNSCKILVAVRPGKYQLQVQPTRSDVPYFVDAKTGSTDGNDGFMDAVPFTMKTELAGTLDETTDLFDWYTLNIDAERNGTLFMTASPDRLECIIYTPNSVDQYGFTGPECGVQYFFQSGVYTVGIGRKARTDLSKVESYTLKWR